VGAVSVSLVAYPWKVKVSPELPPDTVAFHSNVPDVPGDRDDMLVGVGPEVIE